VPGGGVCLQIEELSNCPPEVRTSSRTSSWLGNPHKFALRKENEELVQQLVKRQMELAESMEEKVSELTAPLRLKEPLLRPL
jgi:hypothetical protein